MKKIFNLRLTPLWALLLGSLGFGLQFWLRETGLDHKGLYIADHPAGIASFLLMLLALVVLLLCTWPLKGIGKGTDSMSDEGIASPVSLVAAALLLYCGISGLNAQPKGLDVLRVWGALLCGVLVGIAGALSLTKKKIPFGIYGMITVCLILYVVGSHRTLAAEPQVLVFLFPLLTGVFMLLGAYQQMKLVDGIGHRAFCIFCLSVALVLGLTAAPLSGVFYGGMALWCFAQLWPAVMTKEVRQ